MTSLLEKLPTILVLAVLLGIFVSLRKHCATARFRLWIMAWALIFVHFLVQVFEGRSGMVESIIEAIDIGALELSGIVFLISMTSFAETRMKRLLLFALLAVPTAFHAAGATFDWHMRWVLAGALGLIFFGGAAFPFLADGEFTVFRGGLAAIAAVAGIWVIRAQLRGNSDPGVNAILTLSFAVAGVLFWKLYRRFTPGVITVAGGFLFWGAVFPCGMSLDHFYPKLQVNPELWNVPKFFVAFGMILSLVEDKSLIIEKSSQREHAENKLLERFSRVTSRLLAGKDPTGLCGEIAEAITETAGVRGTAIFLAGADGAPFMAGCSGYGLQELEALRQQANGRSLKTMAQACTTALRLGNNSFRLPESAANGNSGQGRPGEAERDGGGEVLIPLVSSRGARLGWMSLCECETQSLDASALTKLEMLAADLAVTIENSHLHHQLVRSEKLAALGQLVAGVAHELNNPLTGIIGYTELLAGEVEGERPRQRIEKLGHEARRMNRIVHGLLRFARQNNPASRATSLESALKDVLQLREYHLRTRGIEIRSYVESFLPDVAIGEDELKQVLLNLLNNAVDAVEDSAQKTISVHAARQEERVTLRIEDTGPGFADLNRAFDPFYTTKPVGKGTGLGLSICYGIIRECGGEIHLANREPFGASVLLDLPATPKAACGIPLEVAVLKGTAD